MEDITWTWNVDFVVFHELIEIYTVTVTPTTDKGWAFFGTFLGSDDWEDGTMSYATYRRFEAKALDQGLRF